MQQVEAPHTFAHQPARVADARSTVGHFRLGVAMGAVLLPIAYFFWGVWFYVLLVLFFTALVILNEEASHARRYLVSAARGSFVVDAEGIWREHEGREKGMRWADVAGMRATVDRTLLLDSGGATLMEVPHALEGGEPLQERLKALPRIPKPEERVDWRRVAAWTAVVLVALCAGAFFIRGVDGLISLAKLVGFLAALVVWVGAAAYVGTKLWGHSRITDGFVLIALIAFMIGSLSWTYNTRPTPAGAKPPAVSPATPPAPR